MMHSIVKKGGWSTRRGVDTDDKRGTKDQRGNQSFC